MDLKKDFKEFFAEDTTQSFMVLFACYTVLLVFEQLDMSSYVELMKWTTVGFYGQKLTDIKGFKP